MTVDNGHLEDQKGDDRWIKSSQDRVQWRSVVFEDLQDPVFENFTFKWIDVPVRR